MTFVCLEWFQKAHIIYHYIHHQFILYQELSEMIFEQLLCNNFSDNFISYLYCVFLSFYWFGFVSKLIFLCIFRLSHKLSTKMVVQITFLYTNNVMLTSFFFFYPHYTPHVKGHFSRRGQWKRMLGRMVRATWPRVTIMCGGRRSVCHIWWSTYYHLSYTQH
jgi:hypothetical protein